MVRQILSSCPHGGKQDNLFLSSSFPSLLYSTVYELKRNKMDPSFSEQMNASSSSTTLRLAMYPWLAFGHITAFLNLANKLAEKGCSTHLLLPTKPIQLLSNLNLHPHLITFHPITVPHVDGLPVGTQTTADIPLSLNTLLATAVDRTRPQVQAILLEVRPDFVLYDMAQWIPQIARPVGIKSVRYVAVCAAKIAFVLVPGKKLTAEGLSVPPPGYPQSAVVLRPHEARSVMFVSMPFGENISFYERITGTLKECDAIAIRTCREIEGELCDYIGSQYQKPVLLTGPVLPEPDLITPLDDRWGQWLGGFEKDSVVYCAFGSQPVLDRAQLQELMLGLESTGLPFLVTLKPPKGFCTVEEALPDGFEERVRGRGVVTGRWVDQVKILNHPSVGCFVSHCGFGSMWESLLSDCQIVLVPHLGDQILNTRLLVDELKVAVAVELDENGMFLKEDVCKGVKSVMDEESEVGAMVKKNHTSWRKKWGSKEFMDSYVDEFVQTMVEIAEK